MASAEIVEVVLHYEEKKPLAQYHNVTIGLIETIRVKGMSPKEIGELENSEMEELRDVVRRQLALSVVAEGLE